MSSSHMRMKSPGRAVVSLLLCCLLGLVTSGCGEEEPAPGDSLPPSMEQAVSTRGEAILELTREQLEGDVYHYSLLLKVGDIANARLRLHRVVREQAPWRPRRTEHAMLLLHGDFSTFTTNFAPSAGTAGPSGPGLAVYLAKHGIDVWGLDRRWTTAPATGGDLSDFASMGFSGALDDIRHALAFARSIRGARGAGSARMFLAGFSRGGHLAYAYAAQESQRPPEERHVKGLVPIDIYAAISPGDAALRQGACDRRDAERAQLQAGMYDSDNKWFIDLGTFALSAPSAPSPLLRGFTNRGALLALAAQTFLFYAPQPNYHLAGGVFTEGAATELRYASVAVFAQWLAHAPPHQALAEIADSDALLCGEEPLPLSIPLGAIQLPLFYLGAAGGFGDDGLYSTSLVGSTDVTTHVVRRLEAAREREDFGHADLLYAADAPTLAWKPLTEWVLKH